MCVFVFVVRLTAKNRSSNIVREATRVNVLSRPLQSLCSLTKYSLHTDLTLSLWLHYTSVVKDIFNIAIVCYLLAFVLQVWVGTKHEGNIMIIIFA